MCSVSASTISKVGCGTENTKGCFAGLIGMGEIAIIGKRSSPATVAWAMAEGMVLEPISTSTLSSLASLRAALVPAVGSLASSSTM